MDNIAYHNKLMISNILDEKSQYYNLCKIINDGIFSTEHAKIIKILYQSLDDDNQKIEIQQKIKKLILTHDIMNILNDIF
jgi:hypothetical protein